MPVPKAPEPAASARSWWNKVAAGREAAVRAQERREREAQAVPQDVTRPCAELDELCP